MANIVPEFMRTFEVYIDGSTEPGIAEGTFPNFEYQTGEIKGAGIAGSAESIVVGHFGSMTCQLTWRYTPKNFFVLAEPKVHSLDIYADLQGMDAGRGQYVTQSLHMFIKGTTKHANFGSITVGDSMGAETEHEIVYIKVSLDGAEKIELDKYNYIYKVNGVDYMAESRRALGRQ